jgi:hypothetical protein
MASARAQQGVPDRVDTLVHLMEPAGRGLAADRGIAIAERPELTTRHDPVLRLRQHRQSVVWSQFRSHSEQKYDHLADSPRPPREVVVLIA